MEVRLRRRDFLGCLAAGLAAAAVPGCAAVQSYHVELDDGRIILQESELLSRENASDPVFLRGTGIAGGVLLIRREAADYRAIAARCTHQGCQVRPGGEFLTCPCHGSTFDLDGAVVRGPAQRPLVAFPVKVEGGRVEIDLR